MSKAPTYRFPPGLAIEPSAAAPDALARQLLLACLPLAPDRERLAALLHKQPDWQELHAQGVRHGLLPLLYQELKQYPEPLVPAAVLNGLRSWFAAHALRSLQMEQELKRLVTLLRAAKIAVIPYKGPTLAAQAYGDTALRCSNDLDLLVPPDQAWGALQLLLAEGYRLDFAIPQQRWPALRKITNHLFMQHATADWGVEIHWALFNPMHLLPFDLAAHWAALAGGGEGRLAAEETLVMLCAHGTKHLWDQLKWLADLDRLLRNGPPLSWSKVLVLAKQSGTTRGLLLGLHLAQQLCDTPLPGEIQEKIAADSLVAPLAGDVLANLFPPDPERRRFVHEYTFHLKSREYLGDRLRQVLRWLFWPRQADWQLFPLGDQAFWLYYLERPVRMVWKWILRPVMIGTRDAVRGTRKS